MSVRVQRLAVLLLSACGKTEPSNTPVTFANAAPDLPTVELSYEPETEAWHAAHPEGLQGAASLRLVHASRLVLVGHVFTLATYLINETAQPVRFLDWRVPFCRLSTSIEMRPAGSPPPPAPPYPRVVTIAARSRVALNAGLSLDSYAYKPGGTADIGWACSLGADALTTEGAFRDQRLPSDGPQGDMPPPMPPG